MAFLIDALCKTETPQLGLPINIADNVPSQADPFTAYHQTVPHRSPVSARGLIVECCSRQILNE